MNRKISQIIIQTLPLLVGMTFSYLFWKYNIILFGIYLISLIGLVTLGKDRKNEFIILLYAIIIGFIVETIGANISGYQTFNNPDALGIPYWLLLAWGYGFILMKRIGLIISTGSPWTNH